MNPLSRPVLTGTIAICVVILCCLGTWQVKRLAWKTGLIAAVEERVDSAPISLAELMALPPQDREYQPVRIRLDGVGTRLAHVAGSYDGVPGFYVFSLVQLPDGGELPVNHGFVPQDERSEAYGLQGITELTGLYRQSEPLHGIAKWVAAPADNETGTFYARDPEGLLAWLFGDTPPEEGAFYLSRTDNAGPDARPRGGTTRITFANNHLGYAITWYGLALALIGVYVVLMRNTGAKT